jgi:hypothetical protein
LKEVKTFIKNLKGVQHSSLYEPLVTVNYISGKKPELVIFESDSDTDKMLGRQEMERIPLSTLNLEELHQLMADKGFAKKDLTIDCIEHDDGSSTCTNNLEEESR